MQIVLLYINININYIENFMSNVNSFIKTPVVYNGMKIYDYGIDARSGMVMSKKSGKWVALRPNVSGKSPYPKIVLRVNCKPLTIPMHILAHETLNPEIPMPPGISKSDWNNTPVQVRKLCRHLFQVNHIDHNVMNFTPENLEWTTGKENCQRYQDYRKREVAASV
jgi:hypothetical protein